MLVVLPRPDVQGLRTAIGQWIQPFLQAATDVALAAFFSSEGAPPRVLAPWTIGIGPIAS